jgi:hypothetical protein
MVPKEHESFPSDTSASLRLWFNNPAVRQTAPNKPETRNHKPETSSRLQFQLHHNIGLLVITQFKNMLIKLNEAVLPVKSYCS